MCDKKNNETNKINETNETKNISLRCSFCKKKLGLIYFNCQCNGIFCNKHRYTHTHQCILLNIKQQENKKRILENNPKIETKKMIKIN